MKTRLQLVKNEQPTVNVRPEDLFTCNAVRCPTCGRPSVWPQSLIESGDRAACKCGVRNTIVILSDPND